eukprot:scaffold43655_cov51-Phaeocystis_antarctica.AAC.1
MVCMWYLSTEHQYPLVLYFRHSRDARRVGAGLSDVRKERLPVVGVACQGGNRPAAVQLLALLDVAVGQGGVQPHARGLGLPRPDGVGVQRRLDLGRVGFGVPGRVRVRVRVGGGSQGWGLPDLCCGGAPLELVTAEAEDLLIRQARSAALPPPAGRCGCCGRCSCGGGCGVLAEGLVGRGRVAGRGVLWGEQRLEQLGARLCK